MHGRRLTLTALATAAGLLVAACQSGAPVATQLNPTAVAGKPAAAAVRYLKISPAPGAKDVNPGNGITVTAVNGGKITHVTVKSSGDDPVTGALSDRPDPLAQHLRAPHRLVVPGHRHRHRQRRPPGDRDKQLQHADPVAHVRGRDLRGRRRHLRRRHADHADVQRADHQQGRRRAVAPDHHVQAGGRRLVLGRQRATRLPAEGLLARRHHGQLRRPPERRRGGQGRVRRSRSHPVVQHRPVGHRGGQHQHPPDPDLRRRQARPTTGRSPPAGPPCRPRTAPT